MDWTLATASPKNFIALDSKNIQNSWIARHAFLIDNKNRFELCDATLESFELSERDKSLCAQTELGDFKQISDRGLMLNGHVPPTYR